MKKMSKLSDEQFSVHVGTWQQVLLGGVIGGLLGGGINFLLYFAGRFFLGATFEVVDMPITQINSVMVAFASLLPALVGAGILYALARYQAENAFRIFVALAVLVVILSLYTPANTAVRTTDTLLLIAMHFIAMFSTVWGLYQFGMVRDA